MSRLLIFAAAVAIALAPVPAGAGGNAMPSIYEITPTFIQHPPKIDGRLDDDCWQSAAAGSGFRLASASRPATCQTSFRLCCDARCLYIAFECLQPRMSEIAVKFTKDGGAAWQDESVEVFIAPFAVADVLSYHHFVVNVVGAKTYLRPETVEPSSRWRAAASRAADRWFAEIAIPFDMLRPAGRNEDCWRVNFCRNARPPGEESSWCQMEQGSFTKPLSSFARLLQPPSSPRFIAFRSKLVPLKPEPAPAGTTEIKDIPEPAARDPIIPQPRQMDSKDGARPFVLGSSARIVIGDEPAPASVRAAEELNDELREVLGFTLPVVRASEAGQSLAGAILIGKPEENSALRRVCEQDKLRVGPGDPGKEGYILDVTDERILVAGADSLGSFWGVQTLKQLIRPAAARGEVAAVFIRDWPQFALRGVHLLACRDGLAFHGKMIERVLSRFKINHIVLQTDMVDWASHPELRHPTNAMPREDVRKLVALAKRHFIEVTPLVQSPGHLEWAFRGGHNLDIAEDKTHPYCYCPSNPRSYEFIFSVIDEAIELFDHPKYFHAGRDEFDMIGQFPVDEECKKNGKEEMYIRDTLKIYEHLKQKGCRMMMWGDILSTEGYSQKIDRLPKDILINDWRYSPEPTYPTFDFFKRHGFQVLGCTWYDPKNIYLASRDAAAKRIAGMLQTTWNGFANEAEALDLYPEQIYAYILAAAYWWNPSQPRLEQLPYDPDDVFRKLWHGQRRPAAASWFSVNLKPYFNISTHDGGKTIGWLGLGKGSDLSGLPRGTVNLGGVPFVLPGGGTARPSAILLRGPTITSDFPTSVRGIGVGRRASALHFLHTAAWPSDRGSEVGEYVINYDDGSAEHVPLVYGRNITCWLENSPALAYGFAWRSTTADGRTIRLRSFTWQNPHPERTIKSIDFFSNGSDCAPVLLAITGENSSG